MQLQHHNTSFKKQEHSIILICDSVNSPANMGGLLRLADSFGVQKVIFGGISVDLKSPRLKRTARSTQNWIPVEDNVNLETYIPELKKEGYTIVALEITNNSKAINEQTFLKDSKIALVIGDESAGVSQTVLEQSHIQNHITMFGENSSMNVTQATAVALYEITKQIQ